MNITRQVFLNMLSACHNISPGVEPDDVRGKNLTNAALKAANKLFGIMEQEGEGHREGVLVVVRLLAEISCSDDEHAYATGEIERGFEGVRFEERGASIPLPTMGSATR